MYLRPVLNCLYPVYDISICLLRYQCVSFIDLPSTMTVSLSSFLARLRAWSVSTQEL
jgi:hypothetical protein